LKKITPAIMYINDTNTPASREFDDVYFSVNNGALESDYVFIRGNDLFNRWINHKNINNAANFPTYFCVAETGFGTGLNFFRTIQYFQQFRRIYPNHPLKKLIYITTEKHPLSIQDARHVVEHWRKSDFLSTLSSDDIMGGSPLDNTLVPNVYDVCNMWLSHYPVAVAGIHRRHFNLNEANYEGEVVLDLHFGDAADSFAQIQNTPAGLVDAWFLDGFAPSKNDSMWSQSLFEQMANLSKANATFATFTAAGNVKRGLQSSGFCVVKRKGFGRKREMLVGELETVSLPQDKSTSLHLPPLSKFQAPYYLRSGLISQEQDITIVGSGLAGALMALKLTQQGKNVHLIWQGELPGECASGNPIGGFYPQLNAQHNIASQLQLHSFLYASEFYQDLHLQHPFEHDICGALQLGFNDNTQARLHKLDGAKLWPQQVAQIVSPSEASKISNIDIPYTCMHMPKAGWIAPPSLVNACLSGAKATAKLTLQNNTKLIDYTCCEHDGIKLSLQVGGNSQLSTFQTRALVLAMGSDTKSLRPSVLPLRVTRGQVEMVSHEQAKANNCEFAKLRTLLCHKGYFTPANAGYHALGSTYVKDDTGCDVRKQDSDANFKMHTQSMQKASWQDELQQARAFSNNYSRAAVRCSSPDHLPVVGAMPHVSQFEELAELYKALPLNHYQVPSDDKNVFVLTGLGSRGLTTAPLMAEILLSQMLGHAMPVAKPLLDALQPNRFIVRNLIRRQSW
jgi:tRNA 5-methylaminomethyl-2-thiouridine biosynthesis bifunctional protein